MNCILRQTLLLGPHGARVLRQRLRQRTGRRSIADNREQEKRFETHGRVGHYRRAEAASAIMTQTSHCRPPASLSYFTILEVCVPEAKFPDVYPDHRAMFRVLMAEAKQ